MSQKKFEQEAVNEAAKSQCMKRKVGCIIVDDEGIIVGRGYNKHASCSCQKNKEPICCPSDVIHAEVAAIASMLYKPDDGSYTVYITQPPCNDCLTALTDKLNDFSIIIVQEFLKFDDGKDAYDLIPVEWEEALAKVLTFGAKKYKPNNWQQGTPDRYYAALRRHLKEYRKGNLLDPDSGMPHLWHVITNVGFLITLELNEQTKGYNDDE